MDDTNRPADLPPPAEAHAAIPPREPVRPASAPRAAGSRATGALWIIFVMLLALLLGPFLAGRFIYYTTYNELKAGYDVATDTLESFKPRLNDLELASRLVAKRVEPSVVSITRPGRRGGINGPGFLPGQGSGVIVDEAGYIVTNSHVVEGARSIHVRLSDRRTAQASLVGTDPLTDIAVLKIDLPNLIAAQWGDSEEMQVGDLVWALGSPYGLERTLTFGIVSAKQRRTGSRIIGSPYQEYMQTDAAVNPGNSGGPLVNIGGQVVGINAAIFGTAFQGISFAIPSSIAREKYEELRKKGRIDRAYLGIIPLEVPEEVRKQMGLELGEGVFVAQVPPDTPAHRAGLRVGDVILRWNDHVATEPTLLSRAIAATEIGSTANVVLLRLVDGEVEELTLDVQVEARPDILP